MSVSQCCNFLTLTIACPFRKKPATCLEARKYVRLAFMTYSSLNFFWHFKSPKMIIYLLSYLWYGFFAFKYDHYTATPLPFDVVIWPFFFLFQAYSQHLQQVVTRQPRHSPSSAVHRFRGFQACWIFRRCDLSHAVCKMHYSYAINLSLHKYTETIRHIFNKVR